MYSVFLKGKGGKGIATGAGVVLALVPLAFVIIFATWLVLIVVTRYVSVASLTAAALVPVLTIAFQRAAAVRDRRRARGRSSCGGRTAATSSACWPERSTGSSCRGAADATPPRIGQGGA